MRHAGRIRFTRRGWLLGASVLLMLSAGALLALRVRWNRLPYHDSFARSGAEEWQAYGGVWQLGSGAVFNRSDERGAKLITGSPRWTDYKLQGDLQLLGHAGDVGVLVRVRDEELGTDSYDGYYVGLRSQDSALVIGRADHGWLEGRPVPMPGGVHASTWYHLTAVAVGCRIGATATNLATGQSAWAAFQENDCVSSGKVGLRSMSTGGAWRGIAVTSATESELESIWSHAGAVQHPEFPNTEASYNKMREADFGQTYSPAQRYDTEFVTPSRQDAAVQSGKAAPLLAIEQLRTMGVSDAMVRVRGVVTLTDPLYVQDSTGGVELGAPSTLPLNLGDEIESTGKLSPSPERLLVNTSIRLLSDRTLAVPLSISSTQAASGAFTSTLVEIEGYLRGIHKQSDGTITLSMEDESQSFSVVVRKPLSVRTVSGLETGSWLRVHGICVIGSPGLSSEGSFAILARSPEDLEVLAGPPWWSGARILRVIIPIVLLLVCAVVVYLRIERWKMNGILSERERLAHEIHDTLAQSFAGVSFHLQGMRNSMRGSLFASDSDLRGKLDLACDIVATTHREASASIAALHPDADGGRDLLVALERYAARMLNADTFPITLQRRGTAKELSLPVRDALFQVGREAITNVVRHSRATEVALRLSYEPGHVTLEICDQGTGFVLEERAGFGIESMRRRCEAIAAQLNIRSVPGQGTIVLVTAPYGKRHTLGAWVRQTWKHIEARSPSRYAK